MSKACNTCGYRINPNTAKDSGLVTRVESNLYDYCYLERDFVSRRRDCSNYISYQEKDYEREYFQKAMAMKRG